MFTMQVHWHMKLLLLAADLGQLLMLHQRVSG